MTTDKLPTNTVTWKVNTTCNYRCSYCLQSGFDIPPPSNIDEVASLVSHSLKAPHEVKIMGGEVMTNTENIYSIVSKLERRGHWISLCSNLSADVSAYINTIKMCDGKFNELQASLHLEYTKVEVFIEKCRLLKLSMPPHSRFAVINIIQKGKNNIRKLVELKRQFEAEGICFKTNLLINKTGHYISYCEDEYQLIKDYFGINHKCVESYGQRCNAGNSYFVLLPNLDIWKCWDSYMRNDRQMFLGNLHRGDYSFENSSMHCPYRTCSCPFPLIKM